mmetsp:Transcript_98487/g.317528  ORF Transcript_98487/g.317528 Transcript_98487/m.317528 type:complete len:288 (-) Transcript_98487:987-1850(-)
MLGMSRPRAAMSVATRISALPLRMASTFRLLRAWDMPPWQITTPRNLACRNLYTMETVSLRRQKTMTVASCSSLLLRMSKSICRRSSVTASVFSFSRESWPFLIILCSTRSPSVNMTRQRLPKPNSAMPRRPFVVMTSLPGSKRLSARCGGRASTKTCWMVLGTGFTRPPVQSTQTHCLPRKDSMMPRTDCGMVADQKVVWRPPVEDVVMLPCSTISSSWLPKPSSIMRSTSSSTRCLTRSRLQTPRCSRSTSRPGVQTRRSAPCARSRSCGRAPELPKSATLRSRE